MLTGRKKWLALIGLIAISIIVRYLTDRRIGSITRAFRQIAPVIATCEALHEVSARGANRLTASLPPIRQRSVR